MNKRYIHSGCRSQNKFLKYVDFIGIIELNLVVCFQTKCGKRPEENTPQILMVMLSLGITSFLSFSFFFSIFSYLLIFKIRDTYHFYNKNLFWKRLIYWYRYWNIQGIAFEEMKIHLISFWSEWHQNGLVGHSFIEEWEKTGFNKKFI